LAFFVGGCSSLCVASGGGLSAIVSLKAAQASLEVQPIFQLLICPVIDNTATVETWWASSAHAPWLTPSRMMWYRDMYFVDSDDARRCDASPNYAEPELLRESPNTLIAISECDLLAPEGRAFGETLRNAGVQVEVKEYKGTTHTILLLAGYYSPFVLPCLSRVGCLMFF